MTPLTRTGQTGPSRQILIPKTKPWEARGPVLTRIAGALLALLLIGGTIAFPLLRGSAFAAGPNSASDATWADLKGHLEAGLGVPYVFGGADPSGWDCSGYVCHTFNTYYGQSYTHYTTTFENELFDKGCYVFTGGGDNLRDSRLEPGDIIFFYSEGADDGPTHMGVVGERMDGIVMVYHAFTNSFSDIFGNSGTMLQGLDANPGSSLPGIWFMSSGHGKGNWSHFTVYRGVANCGTFEIQKSSADPGTAGNSEYSLAGAVYGVYRNAACTDLWFTCNTDENGYYKTANDIPIGNYWIKEVTPPKNYKLDEAVHPVQVGANVMTHVDSADQPNRGNVDLTKVSSNATLSANKGTYSLAGASYRVADKNGKTVATLTTDKNGFAKAEGLLLGDYSVVEVSAPEGYITDKKTYSVKIEDNKTFHVNSGKVADTPNSQPVDLLGGKYDSSLTWDLNGNTPQGDTTLAGAEFTLKYYDGYYSTDSLPAAAKNTWVFRSDEGGMIHLSDAYKISGGALYKTESGKTCLPLGTVTLQETKAPDGYNLDNGTPGSKPALHLYTIRADKTTEYVKGYDAVHQANSVVRGDYRLIKEVPTTNDSENQETTRVPVKGIRFELINTSKNVVVSPQTGKPVPTGEVVCTITTDENGLASTRSGAVNGWAIPSGWAGALARGSYKVHEVIPADVAALYKKEYGISMSAVEDFPFSIDTQGQYAPGPIISNHIPQMALKVVKTDAETGKTVPLNCEFGILDAQGKAVTYTDHYAEAVVDTWATGSDGMLILPMKLDEGTYTLVEKNAPEGYVLGTDGVKFSVDEYRSWEEPLVVPFADMPIKARITLHKSDASDETTPVAGAEYAIKAQGDIATGDGTVRFEAGQVIAHATTDASGNIVFEGLYLGNYLVYETKTVPGYALDPAEHSVTVESEGQTVALVSQSVSVADEESSLRVVKVNADNHEQTLAGAEFRVVPATKTEEGEDSENSDGSDESGASGDSDGSGGSSSEGNGSSTQGPTATDGSSDTTLATEGAQEEARYITDASGSFTLDKLLPGSYLLEETKAPLGFAEPVEGNGIPFSVNDQGLVQNADGAMAAQLTLTIENTPIEIGTTAHDAQTGTEQGSPASSVTLVDTVTYRGLTPGKTYTVTGTLMDKATGKPFVVEGAAVTSTAKFTPVEESGTVDVTFTFDGTSLAGTTLVVFESISHNGVELAVHADIEDAAQSVTYLPEIHTTAADKTTETHTGIPGRETTLIDTVNYTGLNPGTEYRVSGTLMDAATGKPLDVGGKTVSAETAFTPKEPAGEADVVFSFDGSLLGIRDIVVFEKLSKGEQILATHEDLDDSGQTLSYRPAIHTSAHDSAPDAAADDRTIEASQTSRIIDTVSYEGLIPGETYTMRATLMVKDAGIPLAKDDTPLQAETVFTPKESAGSVDVVFELDTRELAGTSLTVFEDCIQDDKSIASHVDLNDNDQTVTIQAPDAPETPAAEETASTYDKTGVPFNPLIAVAVGLVLGGAGALVYNARRKRRTHDYKILRLR